MELDRDELKSLFVRVKEISKTDQPAFLDKACSGKHALRTELEALLLADVDAEEFFGELADHVLPEEVHNLASASNGPTGPDPFIGKVISHYEIVGRLGSGGMGVVYKAKHLKLEHFVALKFLPVHLSADSEAKARFVQEAKAAYALEHTNICTIYDIGETEDGQIFIAMAFYEGDTMKERIAKGPIPFETALSYISQVAEGLQRAHENGIVHRDIKPANLLITKNDVVKILDFGIAKDSSVTSITKTGRTLGTVAYMSPEQARGDSMDLRTDIWSLGVVWYEMLCGTRPFHAEYEQAFIYSVLNEDPIPLETTCVSVPRDVEQMILKCLEKTSENRYQSAADLYADIYRYRKSPTARTNPQAFSVAEASPGTIAPGDGIGLSSRSQKRESAPKGMPSARIFLSYKRSAEPDNVLAEKLVDALSPSHNVFIDKMMMVGARWVERIESEISKADYFIVLLSSQSVQSEMVMAEIELASRFSSQNGGHPKILPIRVNYLKDLVYPLSVHLDHLNWTYWEDEQDTPKLLQQVESAIQHGELDPEIHRGAAKEKGKQKEQDTGPLPAPLVSAQPLQLESPEGTMDPQSAFYIEREEDALALESIERVGVTLTIKGPRQMGKSSLLLRSMMAAREMGKKLVFIDFQLFDSESLGDAETFFKQFCSLITDDLELEDRVEEFWKRPLGNSQLCTRYMGRHILKSLDAPLFLAMDEVERVFDTDFRSDFFSMLRSWHNDRAIDARWKQLDLALVTSTEPYQLIENLNQSPFNVGEVLSLNDFTKDQVWDLNVRQGSPLKSEESSQLNALLGGHPYLTRKALYLLASGRNSFDDLINTSSDDQGPFGDHLRHHLFRLHGKAELATAMKSVLRSGSVEDEGMYWRLQGAGLVRREGRKIVPRCKLYSEYFNKRLDA